MTLSLSDGERARLAEMGVTAGAQGFLHSANGRPVDPGVAVTMLQKDQPAASGDLSKGMVPARFHRPYLAAGHQADSPANTGMRGTTVLPDSHPAEPQDYQRGWIAPGHEQDSPDDRPANNPHAADAPGAEVYRSAAAVYEANQSLTTRERVMLSQACVSESAPCRQVMLPGDMRAASVPVAVQVAASHPAPGEMR